MKGHLYKKNQPEGWYVAYTTDDFGFHKTELPLHPNDVKQINADAQVFDNIEARIKAYSDVEFEIIKENIDIGALEAPYIKVKYAKLKKSH